MRKNKKYLIFILILIVIVTIILIYTNGKYKIEKRTAHVQNSEKFYFKSDLLEDNEKIIEYSDWDGSNKYVLKFDIQNYYDELQVNNSDINYTVDAKSTDTAVNNIKASINDTTPNILEGGSKKKDEIQIELDIQDINVEEITFELVVSSSKPYIKKMDKTIKIKKSNFAKYESNLVDARRIL